MSPRTALVVIGLILVAGVGLYVRHEWIGSQYRQAISLCSVSSVAGSQAIAMLDRKYGSAPSGLAVDASLCNLRGSVDRLDALQQRMYPGLSP